MRAGLLHALRDPCRDGGGVRRVQGAGLLLRGAPGRVRGILFDAGNTLVQIDPVRMVAIYAAEGVATDVETFLSVEVEVRRVLHEHLEEGATGQEAELWRSYFERLFEMSGVPAEALGRVGERVRDAHRADHLWTYAPSGTGAALEALAAEGYRLGVISNADGRMEGALERAGVRGHVEFVIDSGAVGVEKPAPEIFHAGCEALDMAPEECVYVGDLYPVDYLGAIEAGLGAVLLDPLGLHVERAPRIGSLGELAGWLAATAPSPD